jgi:hypothetical protein
VHSSRYERLLRAQTLFQSGVLPHLCLAVLDATSKIALALSSSGNAIQESSKSVPIAAQS